MLRKVGGGAINNMIFEQTINLLTIASFYTFLPEALFRMACQEKNRADAEQGD